MCQKNEGTCADKDPRLPESQDPGGDVLRSLGDSYERKRDRTGGTSFLPGEGGEPTFGNQVNTGEKVEM